MLKRAPIFAGLLLSAISPLNAQVSIDVAKITCQQFATSKVANPDRIALWLNGYFHGKRGDMIYKLRSSPETHEKSKTTASRILTCY